MSGLKIGDQLWELLRQAPNKMFGFSYVNSTSKLAMSCTIFLLFLFLKPAFSYLKLPDELSFNGYFKLEDTAEMNNSKFVKSWTECGNLTTGVLQKAGDVFYSTPFQFKNSTNGSVFSFSTTFLFAIIPDHPKLGGRGFAFAISSSKVHLAAYAGLPYKSNDANDRNSSNPVVIVEFDTYQDPEYNDMNDNHVGVNINDFKSIKAATAGYYSDKDGSFKEVNLKGREILQAWVEYDGSGKQLNVTIHPINIPKPRLPVLSLTKDLSSSMRELMAVGFTAGCGILSSSHYIMGWSFKMNGPTQEIHLPNLPNIPGIAGGNEGYERIKKMLVVVLSLIGVTILLVLIFGVILIRKRRKFIQVLEDWEVLYGPHRFTYKDLFIATRGFKEKQLLGKGGFGRVYRGMLPLSNALIAVKRISHESKQGMTEFVAEIATIGRLRHPNLVRLLGYCRRKTELFLVYDYMTNGSLDKFLYGQPNHILNWTQRFQIIKDVASALYYLHHQWIQVVIHRDIKPANILIDDDMNARLGDFGLAKLCDHGNDPQTSHVAGTLGYIAPELVRSGKSNTGTDIYAFGLLILEIACGRRPVDPRASFEKVVLIDWIMDCWDRGVILETIDGRLENNYVSHEAELVLKLGLLCSHAVAAARPSMSSVIEYLDGAAQLPDGLNAIIKSRDFGDGSNKTGAAFDNPTDIFSVPSMTLTESFGSHGR